METPRRTFAVIALAAALLAAAGCQSHDSATGSPSPRASGSSGDGSFDSASSKPSLAASPAPTGQHSAKPTAKPPAKPPSHIAPRNLGRKVTKVAVSSDGRTLTLTYWQDMTACGSVWHARDSVSAARVTVWMTYDTVPVKKGAFQCDSISRCTSNCDRTATLKLASPVDGRPVYDADTGNRLV